MQTYADSLARLQELACTRPLPPVACQSITVGPELEFMQPRARRVGQGKLACPTEKLAPTDSHLPGMPGNPGGAGGGGGERPVGRVLENISSRPCRPGML